jgi:hypothetical protein
MGGHSKGSSFERAICKELSLWWTDGKRDDIFWRTAGSGARATVRRGRNCDTANSAGDVCALHFSGQPFVDHFIVELKKGYSREIDVLKMVDAAPRRKPCVLTQWLEKAWREVTENNRVEAWLIFQRDRAKPMLVFRDDFLRNLESSIDKSYPYPSIHVLTNAMFWRFVVLREFLGWYKPAQVMAKGKGRRRK